MTHLLWCLSVKIYWNIWQSNLTYYKGNKISKCFDLKSYIRQDLPVRNFFFPFKTLILDNENTAVPISIPQKKSEIVCMDESGESKVQVKLIEGGSDEVIAELRQVDTNKETVQQQTMKDLHVKYPKQTGRQIHLMSGRWRRIKSPLLNSSFSQCQSGAGATCLSVRWRVHLSHLRLLNTVHILCFCKCL